MISVVLEQRKNMVSKEIECAILTPLGLSPQQLTSRNLKELLPETFGLSSSSWSRYIQVDSLPLTLSKDKITLLKLTWVVCTSKFLRKKGDARRDWCVQLMGEENKDASVFIQSCPQEETVLIYMPGYYWSSSSRAGIAVWQHERLENGGKWGTLCSNMDVGPQGQGSLAPWILLCMSPASPRSEHLTHVRASLYKW